MPYTLDLTTKKIYETPPHYGGEEAMDKNNSRTFMEMHMDGLHGCVGYHYQLHFRTYEEAEVYRTQYLGRNN